MDTERPSQEIQPLYKVFLLGTVGKKGQPDTQEEAAHFLGKVAQVILYTCVYEGSSHKKAYTGGAA